MAASRDEAFGRGLRAPWLEWFRSFKPLDSLWMFSGSVQNQVARLA